MSETVTEQRQKLIEECTITPLGRAALSIANESGGLEDAEALRCQFHIQLIEFADAYDSMDHRIVAPGSHLQHDCQAVRELVRSLASEA